MKEWGSHSKDGESGKSADESDVTREFGNRGKGRQSEVDECSLLDLYRDETWSENVVFIKDIRNSATAEGPCDSQC